MPQSVQANNCNDEFSPLSALVLNSADQPVSGVTVTFTAPSTGPGAVFGGYCGSSTENDVTDAQRIAASSDVYENGTVGSYQVAASAPGVLAPAVFSLTNTSGTHPTTSPPCSPPPPSQPRSAPRTPPACKPRLPTPPAAR
jgi:hypothetical protein